MWPRQMKSVRPLPLLILLLSLCHNAHCQQHRQTQSEEKDVLCPFLKSLAPDTSSNGRIVNNSINPGNVEGVLANMLVYNVLINQQGILAPFQGKVLDLLRLDEVPGTSHPDLYTAQYDGVAERLTAAADADGYVTLQDLVEVKKWVAEATGVQVSLAGRLEAIAMFLGARGSLGEDKVLADDLLRFIRSDWDVNEFGNVSIFGVVRGLLMARF